MYGAYILIKEVANKEAETVTQAILQLHLIRGRIN